MDPKLIRMAAAIMRPLIRQNKAFLEYSSGPGAAPLAGAGNFIPQRFRFFSATQTEGKPNSTGDGASSDESGGGDSKALIELQEQLSKAVAERDTLASKSREFEVCLSLYCFSNFELLNFSVRAQLIWFFKNNKA